MLQPCHTFVGRCYCLVMQVRTDAVTCVNFWQSPGLQPYATSHPDSKLMLHVGSERQAHWANSSKPVNNNKPAALDETQPGSTLTKHFDLARLLSGIAENVTLDFVEIYAE